ncbi:hypothetical protein CU309_09150 [Prochlorococcus marinus str. MU1405]|nr:hypothetical protein [Prochlorococcus marinus str. MU1405]MBW3048467.1 hypothetical protein [Prochlorococcus marinus str. MU1406]
MQSLPRKIRTNKSFKSLLGKINFKKKDGVSFFTKSFKIQNLFLKKLFKTIIFRKLICSIFNNCVFFYNNDIT